MRIPSSEMGFRPLGEIVQIIRGVTYKKFEARAEPEPGYVPLLRATNIGAILILHTNLVYVPWSVVNKAQYLREGDIVLASSSGSLSVVGKSARLAFPWDGTFGAFCAAVRPGPDVDSRYLALYLSSDKVRREWSSAARGTNINNLKRTDLIPTPVPLPALGEQRRIVNILEDYLSRLDAAQHLISAVERRLEAYEASALSRCHKGDEKPLHEIAFIQGGIQKQSKRTPTKNHYPFLRVANVTKNGLRLQEVHRAELFSGELERLRLEPGDLLVVEGNGSPSQIGRAATWDGSIEDCVHQNHLIRVRPKQGLRAEYLEAVWNSPANRGKLTDLASSSSGLQTLSVSKLRSLTLPVPSLSDQDAMVEALSVVRYRRHALQFEVRRSLVRAEGLRRALLDVAFSGRLTGRVSDMDMAEEMAGV